MQVDQTYQQLIRTIGDTQAKRKSLLQEIEHALKANKADLFMTMPLEQSLRYLVSLVKLINARDNDPKKEKTLDVMVEILERFLIVIIERTLSGQKLELVAQRADATGARLFFSVKDNKLILSEFKMEGEMRIETGEKEIAFLSQDEESIQLKEGEISLTELCYMLYKDFAQDGSVFFEEKEV